VAELMTLASCSSGAASSSYEDDALLTDLIRVTIVEPPSAPLIADMPDVLSEILEALGPCSFWAAAPVCRAFRSAVSEKLVLWRKQRAPLCNVQLADVPIRGTACPLSAIAARYEALGVRFRGSAVGVVPGISEDDPGQWQLEGTVRGMPGGGRFVGFNTDGQWLALALRNPASGCSFDLVTRDARGDVTIRATDASGAVLHDATLAVGPEASSWLKESHFRLMDGDAFAKCAIETTHCTAVRLERASPEAGEGFERAATLATHSATSATLALTLHPDDEVARVSFTFHDPPSAKREERAMGLSNICVYV